MADGAAPFPNPNIAVVVTDAACGRRLRPSLPTPGRRSRAFAATPRRKEGDTDGVVEGEVVLADDVNDIIAVVRWHVRS